MVLILLVLIYAPHIFTKKILANERIKLFDQNPSSVSRDFTYITDIVNGIFAAFNYQNNFQIFNFGYGTPIKTIDFIKTIEDLTGKKARIDYVGRQIGDVTTTYADTRKAREILGFSPQINVKEGLKLYIDWYLGYYK